MDRDISPPPPKRRRLSPPPGNKTSPLPTAKPSTPVHLIEPTSCNIETPSVGSNSSSPLRIFAWNVNGIAPFLQKPITSYFLSPKATAKPIKPQASLRNFLSRHNWPHVLFLQEVKIARSDTKTQAAVQRAIISSSPSDTGPEYKAFFTLPNDPHNARGLGGEGKVYGVCSIIRSDFHDSHISRIRSVEWDQEGRVNVVETNDKLAIWNIYAVNGTSNPYRNPKTGEVAGTRHDRKLAFHRLLAEECITMEKQGWKNILAGDFNVAPARIDGHPNLRTWPEQHAINRADFNWRFFGVGHTERPDDPSLHGVDVFRRMKGLDRRYTYHPPGRDWGTSCDRVDLVIASKQMIEEKYVRESGILDTPEERGTSDHVPIWVEVVVGMDVTRPESK
ncbi:DNase I-like protein [Aulographum hederae CBS 113979]|uniref:DNase I-like protein n=1 Tax=Aulographum hederae CBS 113979 TaxID=1176131 RepID=A0A6G1H0H9_9PEZI|nr:DNase I-like protein [Aulographum hederae CBS 113979]